MTQDERTRPSEVDGEVHRAYREAGFDETPPPHVDRTVLQHAERAARRRPFRPRPAHLAWAAAVVLSFALVLELGVLPPPPVERATNGARDGEALRAPEDDGGARSVGQRLESTDTPDGAAGPGGSPEAEEASRLRIQETAPASDAADEAAARACDDTARREPDAWLECIERLRRTGDEAAAARELEALERRFPNRAPEPAER